MGGLSSSRRMEREARRMAGKGKEARKADAPSPQSFRERDVENLSGIEVEAGGGIAHS